jgi:hypothetical protein
VREAFSSHGKEQLRKFTEGFLDEADEAAEIKVEAKRQSPVYTNVLTDTYHIPAIPIITPTNPPLPFYAATTRTPLPMASEIYYKPLPTTPDYPATPLPYSTPTPSPFYFKKLPTTDPQSLSYKTPRPSPYYYKSLPPADVPQPEVQRAQPSTPVPGYLARDSISGESSALYYNDFSTRY